MKNTLRKMSREDLDREMDIACRLIEAHKRDLREARSLDGKQAIYDKLETLREHTKAVSDEIISRIHVFGN